MKKTFAIISLVIAVSDASAEWISVAGNESMQQYVDPASIRRDGFIVKAWLLTDKEKPITISGVTHSSVRSREEFDCKNERSRNLSFTEHAGQMASGEVVWSSNKPLDWSDLAPETIGVTTLKFVCAYKKK